MKPKAHIFIAFFAGFLCSLDQNLVLGQDETAGLEYAVQYAGMDCYLAWVRGEQNDDDGPYSAFRDFNAVYGFRKKGTRITERFETSGSWINTKGQIRPVEERMLREPGVDWLERYGDLFDVHEAKRRDPEFVYTPVHFFDPFVLPIADTGVIRSGKGDRSCLDLMMPHGRMLSSSQLDRTVKGTWFHGAEADIGLTEIVFHQEFGNMPTESSTRFRKKGIGGVLDKRDPYGTTLPYSKTITKWKQIKGEMWVPVEIVSKELGRSADSYDIKIEWWLDEDVPNEVFTLDDFKLAHLRKSRVHQMIAEREKQMTLTEKAKSKEEK